VLFFPFAVLWRLGSFSPDSRGLLWDFAMYHNSSQKRHWTFASEEQLARLRADANRKFKCKAVANGKVLPNDPVFLEPHEEMMLCKYYEKRLLEFCSVFKPAMPRSVVGTACMYFKRFYLNNSVMEYHPRIIMLTCAFLACKVDEFNVSSPQFVGNLRESPLGQEKALEQILEYELSLTWLVASFAQFFTYLLWILRFCGLQDSSAKISGDSHIQVRYW